MKLVAFSIALSFIVSCDSGKGTDVPEPDSLSSNQIGSCSNYGLSSSSEILNPSSSSPLSPSSSWSVSSNSNHDSIIFGTMQDRAGRSYKTIQLGTQIWMAENLAWLPQVNTGLLESAVDAYYYVYDYYGGDTTTAKSLPSYNRYGVLYNKPAALEACPTGWRLPYKSHWDTLIAYANRHSIDLRSDSLWRELDYEPGTPDVGFSAMPGGYNFDASPYFEDQGVAGYWWAWNSDPYYSNRGHYCKMNYYSSEVECLIGYIHMGLSVRCIKQ